MQLIVFGPPGVGKGTLSDLLAESYKIPHISTGEIFRNEIKSGNKELIAYVEKGLLVPDAVVNKIVEKEVSGNKCKDGFILDGYPRTIEQSRFLESVLSKIGKKIDLVLNLVASDTLIIKRLIQRRMCSKCGALFNLATMPPKREGICDNCNSELMQRKDDNEKTIRKRIKVYYDETAPLIEHFRGRGILHDIDASTSPNEILKNALKVIK